MNVKGIYTDTYIHSETYIAHTVNTQKVGSCIFKNHSMDKSMCFHAVDLLVYLCITESIMYEGMPKAQKLDNLINLLRHIYVIWPSLRKPNRKPSSLENTYCGQKHPYQINLTLQQSKLFFFFKSIIACRAKNKLVQHQDKNLFHKLKKCTFKVPLQEYFCLKISCSTGTDWMALSRHFNCKHLYNV